MAEHIRIGDIAPRVSYATDGTQAAFTYPFPIFEIDNLEVRLNGLRIFTGFTVTGAGQSEGGQVVFGTAPAAGQRLTLLRRLRLARTTDFQENGVLRARVLNDELDYQVAALQEVQDALGGTVRLDPSEDGDVTLPPAAARANTVLAFDAVGGVTLLAQTGLVTGLYTGAVPRTVEDKLAEVLSARDFGAVGNGTADDGPALQAAMNAAASTGRRLVIGEGTHRTTMPLTLAGTAGGLTMHGSILYAGPAATALTIGTGGSFRTATRSYLGLRVQRATQSNWLNEADIGIRLINLDACHVEVRQAEGFTIGVQTFGDERSFEDSTLHFGRIANNRYGLDVRVATAAGWNNAITYIGGHFANASSVNPTLSRFGVRFSAAAGAYDRHNAHVFVGPGFELQRQGTPGTVDAIPFLIEADDVRCVVARGVRMEQCSPFVARHVGGANDCVYEVTYNGTFAHTGNAIDYPATATRAGGTVVGLHQAAAAHGTPRLVADAGNIRSRAFRQTIDAAGGVGFDEMTVLSSNPSGPPSTMNGFCWPGLGLLNLNADTIGLPTSRALAFVFDCAECNEFFIAAEGTELRPVVMQFDAAENVMDGAARVLLSNMNVLFAGSPSFWWEGNANLDSDVGGIRLNGLQRVTLHPNARFAAIGVRGGSATATVRSLRIYTAAVHAPALLFGGSRRWGVREYTASAAWDPPSIAGGASTTLDVALPGAMPGDFVEAGFSVATTLPLDADMPSSGNVRARITNNTGGPVDLNAGTLFVRAVKPRV